MIQSKNWIPHNLPLRSKFIGREEAKALVHEALCSRSYLISIVGIGGMGKTSLALEVAYECLQASQHVKSINQTSRSSISGIGQEVPGLPEDLYISLRRSLLECGYFDSDLELRAMFVDEHISPWRDALPEVHTRGSRVNVLIDKLLNCYNSIGENVLQLFLQALKAQKSPVDACYGKLATLASELDLIIKNRRFFFDENTSMPSSLPEHLGAKKIAIFDGFIWTTAKGQTLTLDTILDTIARELEYQSIITLRQGDQKRNAVCKLLETKACLLIVDNFQTITDDAIRNFLFSLPAPSKALLTTREQKLQGFGSIISLQGLSGREALELMRGDEHEKVEDLQSTDSALLDLYMATDGSPLAIKWAIGQMKQEGQSLSDVLKTFRTVQEDDYRPVFEQLWELLSASARHVLMVMPFFITPVSRDRIELVSGIKGSDSKEAIGQLVKMSLLEVSGGDPECWLYSIHHLTYTFVIANHHENTKFVQDALSRLLDYYQGLFGFARPDGDTLYNSYWSGLKNYNKVLDFEAEANNVIHVLRWALDAQCEKEALWLFVSIVHLLHVGGFWDERLELSQKMLKVANEFGDPVATWLWIDSIGYIARQRHDFELFHEALEKGRVLATRLNMRAPLLLARVYEASVYTLENKLECASKLNALEKEIDIVTLINDGEQIPRLIARRMAGAKAYLHHKNEEWALAKKWYEYELELREKTEENPTPVLAALAQICVYLNDIESAEAYLKRAEAVPPTPKDMGWINYSHALVAKANGEKLESRKLALKAHSEFERFGPEIGKRIIQEFLEHLDVQEQALRIPSTWSLWQSFPDPRKGDYLHAPLGPGVYELRHRESGESILFGQGRNVTQRMVSLLPEPFGQGTRRNKEKREYILAHISDIEYRTIACADVAEAKKIERDLKINGRYKFST